MSDSKVALFISGGYEKGYRKGEETLINLVKSWNVSDVYVSIIHDPDESTFTDIEKHYKDGYKIVVSGIPLNSLIASLTGSDIIEPEDIHKKDPPTMFEKYYLNKKSLMFDVGGIKFECLPIYHPLYTFETSRPVNIHNQVLLLRSYLNLTPRETHKKLYSCRSYSDMIKTLDMLRSDDSKYVSYDVETNYLSPVMKEFEITGFSLAFDSSSGLYVVLDSSDFSMSQEERSKCLELLKDILTDNRYKIIVHNLKMEVPATLNNLDYEIPEEKIEDTLVWSKLINSGRTGGNGLKEQAIYRLGYSDWSKDIDKIQSIKGEIKKEISSKDRKGNYKVDMNSYESVELEELVKKYYQEDYKDVCKQLIQKLFTTDNIYSFSLIPSKMLERYGAIDAISTFELYEFYLDHIKSLNEKYHIDMNIGYDLWLESQYASYLLELNSSRWDENQASSDERRFRKIMAEDLSALLCSDSEDIRNRIKDSLSYKVLKNMFDSGEFIKDIENSDIFEGYTGSGRIRYRDESGKVKNIVNDKYSEIMDIFKLSKNKFKFNLNMECERLVQERFEDYSLEELSSILNPDSDIGKKLIMGIIQDDIVKSSKFILDVSSYITSETYNIDVANKEYNQGEMELIDLIKLYNHNSSPAEKFELYERIMNKLGSINLGPKLSRMIVSAGSWKMETLDEANMTELYNLYMIAGYDIDKDHNGDSPFSRLFHVRRYKKTNKLVTTYINGSKLGRSQVYVVDKDEFQSGKKMVKRKRQYTPGELIKEDEDLVFQGTWSPNSVLSGRWSSGIHTLPAWSDPKRYLSSRFKGGCSVIADFSQAEIRVVARASNEENLLNAYKNGEDVHMKTAMNIFQKPASEISEVERRFSKMGTFHILYGGDPSGFAHSYLNGDLAYANRIFEGFYGGYPKLKVWKEAREEEVKEYGLVTTMTNRYIFLGHEQPGIDVNKIIRQSGNAPIQGPSSDIAASAVYNISKFIEDKHLKSKLYCFIHDSIEADVAPDELFYVMESFQYQMNNYPYDRFQVPAKSDLTLGATLGEEVEVISYKPDSDYKGGWLHLEGNGDEVDRLLARWSEFWDHIDVKWISRKYKYQSYRELFAVKRAFTRRIGGMNSKVELEVRLRYDKGLGCRDKFKDYDKLFPLEDPIIYDEVKPYTEYVSNDTHIYVDKELKGYYKNNNTGDKMIEISFNDKEQLDKYVNDWKFAKIGKVGLTKN